MRYLLLAILLLGTQIASAQSILKDKDDKELSVLLNEVVITGTGTEPVSYTHLTLPTILLV